jgi:hypothetical protein
LIWCHVIFLGISYIWTRVLSTWAIV